MDIEKRKRKNNNEEKYHYENLKIARDFTKDLVLEMKETIRSVVLFGSNAKDTMNKDSDIDILIVLDNITSFITEEIRTAYLALLQSLNRKYNDKLHILNMDLTNLWDYARKGDPLLINILRYGVPLFDRDLIEPLQYLLEIGKIKPSKETVYNYVARSNKLIEYNEKYLYDAILDLYYAIVDAVHASLIVNKIIPPSPEDMPNIFKKTFKNNKELINFYEDIQLFYELSKKIEHKKIDKINGQEYEKLFKKAKKLIEKLNTYTLKKVKETDNFEL